MQPENEHQRSCIMNKIRGELKKLPIMRVNSLNLESKTCNLKDQRFNSKQMGSQQNNNPETPKEIKIEDITGFFEKYQMGEQVGEGTNGFVRKCIHKVSKKIYAVKLMKIEEEQRKDLRQNFFLIKSLDHPNIIKYKAVYMDYKKSLAYLVMHYEIIPSLKNVKKLTQDDLQQIMRQLLTTIQYCHSKNLCHRDINPSNILFDQVSKKIVLIDFGISKKTQNRSSKIQMLTITGSLFYRAPEMFQGSGYDEKVDLWSVGITLYYLVTGETPFQSEYVGDTINKIRKGKIQFDEPKWKMYSNFVRDILNRLLKKKEERLTAAEARRHFWFNQIIKNKQIAHSERVKSEQKEEIDFPSKKRFTDQRIKEDVEKIRSQLRKWNQVSQKDSNVIEIDSQEQIEVRKRKNTSHK